VIVRPSTRDSRAARANRSRRAAGLVFVLLAVTAACGKKGPPLAPFARVPALITAVTPQRVGDDVFVSFKVPDTNADGQKPADIGEVDVYAVTSAIAPATEKQREVATLVATLPVRPILPEPPVPANGSPPLPPIPLPPGVDRGAAVAVKETLTPETRVAVELPVDRLIPRVAASAGNETPFGPLVAPAPTELPRRHYFVIARSPRGRESVPSTPVSIPLEAGSSAPGAPVVTNTASEMTITWAPSPDARTSTFLLSASARELSGELRRDRAVAASGRVGGPPEEPIVGASAAPSNTTPKVVPPLTAKSLGFNSAATTYHVYDVTSASARTESGELRRDLAGAASGREGGPPMEADPYDIKVPTPLTPAPVAVTEFVIKGVPFGTERCFEVRPVDQIFGTMVIGPASPRTCYTPKDTFAPAAPKSLAAIAGAGVINLIWDANAETDLAGYIVLRGEAPGDTLQPVTKEPVTVTSFRDESVRAGTRYVYAVVAVDRAGNNSPQSNRAEETARQ